MRIRSHGLIVQGRHVPRDEPLRFCRLPPVPRLSCSFSPRSLPRKVPLHLPIHVKVRELWHGLLTFFALEAGRGPCLWPSACYAKSSWFPYAGTSRHFIEHLKMKMNMDMLLYDLFDCILRALGWRWVWTSTASRSSTHLQPSRLPPPIWSPSSPS